MLRAALTEAVDGRFIRRRPAARVGLPRTVAKEVKPRDCSYTAYMQVATLRSEVGIRELKNGLSGYIDRVRNGEEVIVTDRGRPVARLLSLEASHDRLAELIAAGIVRAPTSSKRRHVPQQRIKSKGTVSDLVAEQRR